MTREQLDAIRARVDDGFPPPSSLDIALLLAEVERLTAERDELIRWREGWLAVDEMCESVAIAAAFQRGVAAMREAAAVWVADFCSFSKADRIRALPDPEDTE